MRKLKTLTIVVLTAFSAAFAQMPDLMEKMDIDFTNQCVERYNSAYSYYGPDYLRDGSYSSTDTNTVVETAELITDSVETTPELDSAEIEFNNWLAQMEAEADSLHATRETRAKALAQYSETEVNLAKSLGFSTPTDAIKHYGKRHFAKWVVELEENYRLVMERDYGHSNEAETEETSIAIEGGILE